MERELIIPGEPIARPRQRVGVIAGHARTFTDAKHPVHAYKAAIRLAWGDGVPFDGPVTLIIEAVFARPKSKVWKSKPMPSYPHTSKPDFDNVAKSCADALNGLAFRDDSQVTHAIVTKRVAAGSFKPAPAMMVSCTWASKLSSGASTAAMPPCAQALEPSVRARLVTIATRCVGARRSAADNPARPLPTIRTSKTWCRGCVAWVMKLLRFS